jgi:hypothetical protein
VPFDIVCRRSKYRPHVNAHILQLKDDLWCTAGVTDISSQIAAAIYRCLYSGLDSSAIS